jgi:succinate-semialdehyde dehydrogenase/glutarate-semialdehyde dehydrogenase
MAIALTDRGLFREACYIDGAWMAGAQTVSVDNPATGEILGTVPRFGAEETRWAIGAAAEAFVTWRATTARTRAQILRR